MCSQALFALELLSFGGDFACLLFSVHYVEGVACCGGAVEAEYGGGLGWEDGGDALVALVEHGFDAAVVGACQEDVAYVECAVGHEDGGDVAAPFVE